MWSRGACVGPAAAADAGGCPADQTVNITNSVNSSIVRIVITIIIIKY